MSFKFSSGVLPLGFKACGISAKIKKSGKKDLAFFYSTNPCVAGAFFTSNRIQAAPLEICRQHLKKGSISAIIANSGNANCMTGAQGLRDARVMTQLTAKALGIKPENVCVSSTGIIGKPLPMDKICRAIPQGVKKLSSAGIVQAAQAMMTTDTFAKETAVKVKIGKSLVTIAGVAKGAGMIAPRMKQATLLSYIFTDVRIPKTVLEKALSQAIGNSFNAITIDACMSTNDTVILLANGAAENKTIESGSKEEVLFTQALNTVCVALAQMIVRDAEGITKFIEINVRGAATDAQAQALAFSVANSNLFKCAMFGSDPNWGRIAAALGSVPSDLSWENMEIYLNKQPVFKNSKPVKIGHNKFLRGQDINVDIYVHQGTSNKTVYTSDLSYGYVRINADYN